jgi:hypothetical protein
MAKQKQKREQMATPHSIDTADTQDYSSHLCGSAVWFSRLAQHEVEEETRERIVVRTCERALGSSSSRVVSSSRDYNRIFFHLHG